VGGEPKLAPAILDVMQDDHDVVHPPTRDT